MSRLIALLRSNWKTALDAATSAVLIAAALTLVWWNLPKGRPSVPKPDVPSEAVSIEGAALRGSPAAQAVMIVFSDFECPYCASFAKETMPQLEREYVAPGHLQIAHRYFPLDNHPHAPAAARAAECANQQGRFWPMHDQLFATGAKLDDEALREMATSLGLNADSYSGCIDGETSKAAVARDKAQSKALGLISTPAFLLGSRTGDGRVQVVKAFYGALPVEYFRSEIDHVMNPGKEGWFRGLFGFIGAANKVERRTLSTKL